ncbi:hypothetical protein ABB02_00503 [Clostridiaceae bacterium JG1575]|nr:hypothetical protein ABB02_00503 [Clostridiaceae bacterium JG1575]
MKELLLLLLLAHTLGDFYLQGPTLSKAKAAGGRSLMLHAVLYGLPYAFVAFLHGGNRTLWLCAFWCTLFHGIIDWGKIAWQRREPRSPGRRPGLIFLLDQAVHALTILLTAFFVSQGAFQGEPWPILTALLQSLSLTVRGVLQWTLALLLIARPSNIAFVQLFSLYKPGDDLPREVLLDIPKEKLKAGAMIGFLEKLISLLFLAQGQYMALGLVLTAKSIARYDRISRSASFAEYYLIGTLTSLILALLTYALCFNLLA